MINALQTALSGLLAASKKVEAGAANIANLTTAGSLDDPDYPPYAAQTVTQTAVTDSGGNGLGVKSEIVSRDKPFVPAFSPDSPFANEQGLIGTPAVDLAEEAVNINLAEASYKANLKVLQTVSDLQDELIRTFDKKV